MSKLATIDAGFRDLFVNSGSVMLLVEPKRGLIVEANPAAVSYYGYPQEELIGRSIEQINTLAWEETALERKRALDPERNNFIFRHRLASGELRDVEVYFSRIDANGGPLVFSIVHDVTGLKQAQEDLRASEAIYRSVFRTSLDAVSINRLSDGMFVDVNRKFLESLGYKRAEIIGKTSLELNFWVNRVAREQLLTAVREKSPVQHFEVQLRKRNGELFWGLTSASEVEIDGIAYLVSVMKDISDVKQAEERIRRLVFYDPLTSLPNRRLLLDRIKQSMEEAVDNNKAVLLLDLMDLRRLNETIGNKCGDLFLKEIAKRLVACTRESDTVARTAGNEFAIMVEDLSAVREEAVAQVHAIAKKIQESVSQPCRLANHECQTATSIGIAVFSSRFKKPGGVLRRAQIALSQAKAGGPRKVSFYSAAMQSIVNARLVMEEDLRHAIKADQLVLHYQPQVTSAGLVGAESLVRWNHPTRGILAPGEFIQLAEETGLIHSLGEWVLNSAFSQVALWAKGYELKGFRVAINISAKQFQHPEFLNLVLDAAERSGANPANITLELTESIIMDDVKDVVRKMTLLKSRGFRISMDDFGTGYSSLSYVKKLPLDELKIDRSFVKDILVDPSSGAIARTILSLVRDMGLSVIAEGVETAEQRDFLTELGCHCFQGYLVSRPVGLEAFERAWLVPIGNPVARD
jgi:diguanylate cyclase (GGDEF)-like protein/PAS domain S-box-containing protein